MAEGQPTAFVFGQSRREQGLKTLAVGNPGQRILLGQALQGVIEVAALARITQAATQHLALSCSRTSQSHTPFRQAFGLASSSRIIGREQRPEAGRYLAVVSSRALLGLSNSALAASQDGAVISA